MRALSALIDSLLADLVDTCLSQPHKAYSTLAPVWVMPIVKWPAPPFEERGYAHS
jgi:hypothetical protein